LVFFSRPGKDIFGRNGSGIERKAKKLKTKSSRGTERDEKKDSTRYRVYLMAKTTPEKGLVQKKEATQRFSKRKDAGKGSE